MLPHLGAAMWIGSRTALRDRPIKAERKFKLLNASDRLILAASSYNMDSILRGREWSSSVNGAITSVMSGVLVRTLGSTWRH